jgi:hypothetical protein
MKSNMEHSLDLGYEIDPDDRYNSSHAISRINDHINQYHATIKTNQDGTPFVNENGKWIILGCIITNTRATVDACLIGHYGFDAEKINYQL